MFLTESGTTVGKEIRIPLPSLMISTILPTFHTLRLEEELIIDLELRLKSE
jgi:hypothetical protein